MKKIIFTLLLIVSFGADAGLLDNMMHGGKTINSTKYKVGAPGYDLRVVEWIPLENKNVRCVYAGGQGGKAGVACYNIKQTGVTNGK